jgi:hypothetical protein
MRRTRQAAALRDSCRLYEWSQVTLKCRVLRYLEGAKQPQETSRGKRQFARPRQRAEYYKIGFLYRGLQ